MVDYDFSILFLFHNHTNMIRFSNRVKYGIQFLLFLSVDEEGFTGIQRAAISCQIPQKFLEAIAVDLKKSKVLDVKRGAGGGYKLSRLPKDIFVSDVVRILDQVESKPVANEKELIIRVVDETLVKVMDDIWKVIESVSIEDIRVKYSNSAEKLMYYI